MNPLTIKRNNHFRNELISNIKYYEKLLETAEHGTEIYGYLIGNICSNRTLLESFNDINKII